MKAILAGLMVILLGIAVTSTHEEESGDNIVWGT